MDRQTALKNTIQLIESAYFTLGKEWTINPSHLDTFTPSEARALFGELLDFYKYNGIRYQIKKYINKEVV